MSCRAAAASARPSPRCRNPSSTSTEASSRPATPRPRTSTPPPAAQTRTSSRCRRARTTRGWPGSPISARSTAGRPGAGAAASSRSTVSWERPVRSMNAARNRGFTAAASASQPTRASVSRTHLGSSSVKTTECAVKARTPASRWACCGTTVVEPSGGGRRHGPPSPECRAECHPSPYPPTARVSTRAPRGGRVGGRRTARPARPLI